jgi:hypothetical protein
MLKPVGVDIREVGLAVSVQRCLDLGWSMKCQKS